MEIRPSSSIKSFFLEAKLASIFSFGWVVFGIVAFTVLAFVGYQFVPKNKIDVIRDQVKICENLRPGVNFAKECKDSASERYPERSCATSIFATDSNLLGSCYICNMECYLADDIRE